MMLYKKVFSYGLAVLGGALIALVAISYSQLISKNISLESEQHEELAEAGGIHLHDHSRTEEHHHKEENIVRLTEEQIQRMGLKFETAGSGNLSSNLSMRGKIILHPDYLAHILPKVSGVVREANKNIGNFVKAGEIMAILESRDIADIKASYLASLSKKRLAAASLDREERLYKQKISAGQDYLNAKNVYEESVINLQLARQKLHTFGLNDEEIETLTDQKDPDLRMYYIRAPIDGTVIMRHITKGEFVESTTTIYEVADLSTVWVEIGIYPKDLYRVKEGQLVEVINPVENQAARARLIYISPIVADETITAKAIAELDNRQGLWKPGVFVKVNVATEKKSFPVVIPKEAIQTSDGKDFIFIVNSKGFERRFVKLGMADQDNVEIISGLNPGEQYVVNKTFLLKAELGKSTAEHEH